jgi:hypothetical protein
MANFSGTSRKCVDCGSHIVLDKRVALLELRDFGSYFKRDKLENKLAMITSVKLFSSLS